MKTVLDSCVLKLSTFPAKDNPAAIVLDLCLRSTVECWASPAMLDEYCDVLADEPDLLMAFSVVVQVCYPLSRLDVIHHEPDNRFLECALACEADYLITVNTARGHFDRKRYGSVRVTTPGEFVNLDRVQTLILAL